jgi:uncharacterized protein YaiI (UPF0178 family)
LLPIFVDADAGPVKQGIGRVAKRFGPSVAMVAGSRMRVPEFAKRSRSRFLHQLDEAINAIRRK